MTDLTMAEDAPLQPDVGCLRCSCTHKRACCRKAANLQRLQSLTTEGLMARPQQPRTRLNPRRRVKGRLRQMMKLQGLLGTRGRGLRQMLSTRLGTAQLLGKLGTCSQVFASRQILQGFGRWQGA